jgi:hypothetical protein
VALAVPLLKGRHSRLSQTAQNPRFKRPPEARFVSPMYKETGGGNILWSVYTSPSNSQGGGKKLTSAAELPVSLRLTSIDASRENNSPPIGEASVAMQIR